VVQRREDITNQLMTTISESLAIAIERHRAGDVDAAGQIYRQVLELDPNQADALHLLGVIALQTGRYAEAAQQIRRAIAINGTEAGFYLNLAQALKGQGDLVAATTCYRKACELDPNNVAALFSLGNAILAEGQAREATDCFRRAVTLLPDYAEGYSQLGRAFLEQEMLPEAVAALERAIALKPRLAEAHNNLGNALKRQGNLAAAVSSYTRALECRPQFAEAYVNLGNVFQHERKFEKAIACYRQALRFGSQLAEAHYNLGIALEATGKSDEAVACYRRALVLRPDLVEAHNNLGNCLLLEGKPEEAAKAYAEAIERKPTYAEAWCNLGNAHKDLGELSEAIACYERASQLKPELHTAHHNRLYALWFCPSVDRQTIWEAHRRWAQRWAEPLAPKIVTHPNDRSENRKLRIGYISPDFRSHALAFFAIPLLSNHDRSKFEIVCYSDVTAPDEMTARLRSHADQWTDIVGHSDEAVAQRIRQDRIDILVDLTMHMERSRLLVFARKPAPVQVTWCAYPGTTGMEAIGYRITDPYLDPAGLNDEFYSEESIRLPDSFWCYDPLTAEPQISVLPALANGFVTFGCLNNFCKINDEVLETWGRVLRAVPMSCLVMLAPEGRGRGRVLQAFARAGVTSDRVSFVKKLPRATYLEQYQQIDLGLDTWPYNGHTTSLDSFWMGVPVVTLVGERAVSRAGFCQSSNLGLQELLAFSADEFVDVAVKLANDWQSLGALRASLRSRMEQSPLMNGARFASNMESAYRLMWTRWSRSPS
jgi:protein O-GlcNAc transferase